MPELKPQYRLLKLTHKRKGDEFYIALQDITENNYGFRYAKDEVFDSEEDALEHAMKSDDWKYTVFTVLKTYTIYD